MMMVSRIYARVTTSQTALRNKFFIKKFRAPAHYEKLQKLSFFFKENPNCLHDCLVYLRLIAWWICEHLAHFFCGKSGKNEQDQQGRDRDNCKNNYVFVQNMCDFVMFTMCCTNFTWKIWVILFIVLDYTTVRTGNITIFIWCIFLLHICLQNQYSWKD